jgi:hypothetical protein
MKVQELIDALSTCRADAEVVVWFQSSETGEESYTEIVNIKRDKFGQLGINWFEDQELFPHMFQT